MTDNERRSIHQGPIAVSVRINLQGVLDELRAIMETKSSEDAHRLEVEESKEEELDKLCPRSSQLYIELGVPRE